MPQTNQRAELAAILRALEIAPISRDVQIRTDSRYSIDCVTVWYRNWERNNWQTSLKKPVLNRDLVRDILTKIRERKALGTKTDFVWIKGHANEPGNIAADRLAVLGAQKPHV
jgi:ribonuclease HI